MTFKEEKVRRTESEKSSLRDLKESHEDGCGATSGYEQPSFKHDGECGHKY